MSDRMNEMDKISIDTIEPKFYILVPVYKVEKYIRECIESVLKQTYQDFQLILVDDGTPDKSGEICDQYAKGDRRVTVIHQENKGLLAARETAIRYVRKFCEKGAFLVYLDSDDFLKTYALEQMADVISEYNCDMVIYGMERVWESGDFAFKLQDDFSGIVEDKRKLYKRVFNSSSYNPVWRKAVSIELLSDIDYSEYYYIRHGEDLIRSIAYYGKCRRVYFLNENLYNYRINPDSITQNVTDKNFEIDFTVRHEVFKFLQSEAVFTEKDWAEYREYCVSLLTDKILTILCFDISIKKKIQYFNEIQNSDYYKKCIKKQKRRKSGKKEIIYILFEKKIYRPLIIAFKLYRLKSKLLRF